MTTRVGFVGVGVMGGPMAGHLLRAGVSVTVCDLDPARTVALRDRGATVAATPVAAASGADTVFCMLPMPDDTERVVLGPGGVADGLHPGGTVIDMSTNSPSFACRIAERLTERGLGFLEAPVTLGEPAAREGTLTIMVAGERARFEQHRALFEAMGREIYFLGAPGSAQLAKLVTNIAGLMNLAGIAEGMVLATKCGIEPTQMFEILTNSIADGRLLRYTGPKLLAGDFSVGFSVELAFKDLGLAVDTGREHKVPLPLTSALKEAFAFVRAKGRGDWDCRALVTLLEDACGVEVRQR